MPNPAARRGAADLGRLLSYRGESHPSGVTSETPSDGRSAEPLPWFSEDAERNADMFAAQQEPPVIDHSRPGWWYSRARETGLPRPWARPAPRPDPPWAVSSR
jgi:hypothetical protein